jgi:hypothetical protein
MHKQHFGYDTVDASGSRNWNTFYCVEVFDFKTKTIVEPCPECENIKQKKALFEATKKGLEQQQVPPEAIRAKLEPLDNWIRKHNLDAKWYINVKTVEGEYCTLKIGTKLKKKLDALREELLKPTRPGTPSVDLFDPETGIYLEFIRSGKGFDTDYDVRPATETKMYTIDGASTPVMVHRKAPMADTEKEDAEATTYDIVDVGIRRLPKSAVAELVKCDGSPEAVEAIFKAGQPAPKAAPAPRAAPAPVAPTTEQLDARQETQKAQAAALVAQVEAAPPPAKVAAEPGPKPAPKAAPAVPDYLNMSIEQLEATFAPK